MKEEALHKKDSRKKDEEEFILVLYNDDVNTFTHVIKSLVEVCGHDDYQAEQCAMLTHFKGRCDIKTGGKELLLSMNRTLKSRGLISKVESL
ncbi:MAG: Clp protease ClpS [Odoribacter sp.]|nr:Clp protease ClpS [Odoribacter sp.]